MDQKYSSELYHYGTLGQKWGVRRYQNPDGTLTEAGKLRYRSDITGKMSNMGEARYRHDQKKFNKDINRADERMTNREKYIYKKSREYKQAAKLGTESNIRKAADLAALNKHVRDQNKFLNEHDDEKQRLGRITKRQRIGTIAGTAAAAAGSAYIAGTLAGELAVGAIPAALVTAGGSYIYRLTKR